MAEKSLLDNGAVTQADEQDEPEERSARSMDPEILLLSRMARQLETLEDDAARSRVVRYLYDRYPPTK